MRKILLVGAGALGTLFGAPVSAQVPVIMLMRPAGPAAGCYDLNQAPNPKWIVTASERADKAFAEYLDAARAKGSLKKLFVEKKNWALYDMRIDAVDATDPWADHVQRYERTSLTVSNVGKWWFRGVWNVYGADGQLLGRYDAQLQGGRGSAFFEDLHLFSPNSTTKASPLTAYCRYPGDIQARQEEQRRRQAEKDAKRAAEQR